MRNCPLPYLHEVLSVTELPKIQGRTINSTLAFRSSHPEEINSAPLLILNSRKASPPSALPSGQSCKADYSLHQENSADSSPACPTTPHLHREDRKTTAGCVVGAPHPATSCDTAPKGREQERRWRPSPRYTELLAHHTCSHATEGSH